VVCLTAVAVRFLVLFFLPGVFLLLELGSGLLEGCFGLLGAAL
jgi:hypothetical protein